MRSRRMAILLACLLSVLGVAAFGQAEHRDNSDVQERLTTFAGRLRLTLSLSSFAVYAPSLGDLRLHAQQIVNLLEGSDGTHYIRQEGAEELRGLRSDVVDLIGWFADTDIGPDVKVRIAAATRNITIYLKLALESALAALRQRRLDGAIEEMLRVYAFLAAAYERPSEFAHVPGLWTILRQFDIAEEAPNA